MPRTQINYPQPIRPEQILSPGSEPPYPDSTVNVVWGKYPMGNVQVMVDVDLANARRIVGEGDARGPGPGRTGFYCPSLDRDEVNHLIRSLQKARDQAYGRDA